MNHKKFLPLVIGLLLVSSIPHSSATSLNYSQFQVALGDATYACLGVTVEQKDIATTSNLLTSNANKKAAQIHADSFYKQFGSASTILYSIEFSIPYQPKPDTRQAYDPQTIEAAAEIKRGDINMKYTSGIQLVLNPWLDHNVVHVWNDKGWVSVANISVTANTTYRFTIFLDKDDPSAGYVRLEVLLKSWSTVGQWHSFGSRLIEGWNGPASYWVTAENISAWPNCSLGIGFINTNNWYNPSVSVS